MSPIKKAVLAVLLCGNAVVLFDFFHSEAARHFDALSFEQRLGEIFPEPKMEQERFDDPGLLPDDYFFFLVYDPGDVTEFALLSVYVGYYPFKGLGTASPHDPRVCYPAQGYELVGASTSVSVGARTGSAGYAASRLVVRSGARDDERVIYYWVQEQGELPAATGLRSGAIGEIWERYQAGRSDLIWVRIEVLQADMDQELSDEWKRRLYLTMEAAAKAML